MEHSPSWSDSRSLLKFSAFYVTLRFITVFKSPASVPVLSQMHPIHTFPTYFPKIPSNIIFPCTYTLRHSKWSIPFRFPDQNFVRIYYISRACYVPRLSHLPWFYDLNNIWWRTQVMQLFLCNFLQSPTTYSLLASNILLNTLFSNILNLCSSLNMRD